MSKSKGSADQDIGRPGPWGEGRYQREGDPAEVSVRTPPGTSPGQGTPTSTPVTRQDYESPGRLSGPADKKTEPPGGDAG
jgi:hypothetical protein